MRARLITVAPMVAALLAGAVLLAACDRGNDSALEPGVPEGLAPRTISAGSVQVKIEPRQISDDRAVFTVTLDTHSGSLDVDFVADARLAVDGRAWGDPSWEGAGPGGHHRQGELRFTAGGPARGTARLTIDGFDEAVVAEWRLGGGP